MLHRVPRFLRRLALSCVLAGPALLSAPQAFAAAETLWLSPDRANPPVINVDRAGNYIRQAPFFGASGVAVYPEGNALFAAGPATSFSRFDLTTLAPLGTLSLSPVVPSFGEDLAYDGRYLYRADYSGQRIVRFDPTTGVSTLFKQFSGTEAGGPVGLAWTGSGFYVSMYNQGRILQLDVNGNVIGSSITVQSSLMSLYGGLGWDEVDQSLWVGTVGRVFEINLSGGVLGGFVLPNPYNGGTFVDGLEFQNASTPGLPTPASAPGSLALVVAAVACLGVVRRQRRGPAVG